MPKLKAGLSSLNGRSITLRHLGDTFRRMVDILEREKLRYVVIGALAVRAYIPSRRSADVDLLVSPTQLGRVVRAAHGPFVHVRTRGDEVAVLQDRRTGVEVHVRAAHERSDRQALASAITIDLFGRKVRLPAPEYLAVMKLASMRGQRKHMEDVLALLRAECLDVRFVAAVLMREHPTLAPLFLGLVTEATPMPTPALAARRARARAN